MILVIAEHNQHKLSAATFNALAAAKLIGGDIHLLLAGYQCGEAVAEAAKLEGVSVVWQADSSEYQHFLAENVSLLIANFGKCYSHILMAATSIGKDVLPRVAALLDVAQISDVTAILSPSRFKRPIYAGNVIVTLESLDAIKVMTIRTSAFPPLKETGGNAEIKLLAALGDSGLSQVVSAAPTQSERPDLNSARIVISGGRGLGSKENFALLEKLASPLGAAIGASRAAVDAGYISNDYQVGQTGKIVAPELYIAIGISGAIQHLAGMKESKIIVAINKDENAPIFEIADYGLVMDLFEALSELEKLCQLP